MTARIFIHPKSTTSPGSDHLAACLADHGYDMAKEVLVYHQPSWVRHPRHELVRDKGPVEGGTLYERMDGVQFVHPTTRPEAA